MCLNQCWLVCSEQVFRFLCCQWSYSIRMASQKHYSGALFKNLSRLTKKKLNLCIIGLVCWQSTRFVGSWWCFGWVGLWGFLWWAPSAKRKDHHRVSSGWSSVWHHSNTGQSSTQYEQIPIVPGVWPFWLTPFFFRSITFRQAYG